jgi:hypothetical protein
MATSNKTPKELAAEMNISEKSLRSLIRRMFPVEAHAGQGNRYSLTPEVCDAIKRRHATGSGRKTVTLTVEQIKSK